MLVVCKSPDSSARLIERFGLPQSGAETRFYVNHALSYDQTRRTPRWVAEHLSAQGLLGHADRKHCRFRPDPGVPELFTARNEDYLRSGWSRGHMAPAGDNKSSERAMAETFYLSNIVPQNYENNAGFWNRLEMYCRELTQSFSHVWIVSGPLLLPRTLENGSRTVCYQLIGKDDVAVPTHLYKVILAQNDSSPDSLALGAFVVPNAPIGFERPLTEFQVSLSDLERMSGLTFFPAVERRERLKNLCDVDSCQLMDLERFTLYISGRKVASARTLARLEKIMTELKDAGVTPDHYLSNLYLEKKRELEEKEEREKKPEP
uniref:Nuclease EXOG, mitochondrial n=1 Tax=Cyprinus carpio TaxID=7962 RepID=A0A8C1YBW3_CYPCA